MPPSPAVGRKIAGQANRPGAEGRGSFACGLVGCGGLPVRPCPTLHRRAELRFARNQCRVIAATPPYGWSAHCGCDARFESGLALRKAADERGWTLRWGIGLLRRSSRTILCSRRSPCGSPGALWADDLDLADPLVGPVNGRMAGLPHTTVFIGTQDILLAETHRFRDLATAAGVEVDFYEVAGDVHAYPLWPTVEAKRARRQIVEALASTRAA